MNIVQCIVCCEALQSWVGSKLVKDQLISLTHSTSHDALCCNRYTLPAGVWFVDQYYVCTCISSNFKGLNFDKSHDWLGVWQQSHWGTHVYFWTKRITGGQPPCSSPGQNATVLYMLWTMTSLTIINTLSKYSTSSDAVTCIGCTHSLTVWNVIV